MTNKLASSTLARLYLAQGHPGRARTMLDLVLRSEPYNGMALALRERLRVGPAARVAIVHHDDPEDRGFVEIEWSIAARSQWPLPGFERDLDVVLALAGPDASLRFDSRRCPDPSGQTRIAVPPGPGSASAALVGHLRGAGLRVLAVAEATTW